MAVAGVDPSIMGIGGVDRIANSGERIVAAADVHRYRRFGRVRGKSGARVRPVREQAAADRAE